MRTGIFALFLIQTLSFQSASAFDGFDQKEIRYVLQKTATGKEILSRVYNPYDCEGFFISENAVKLARSERNSKKFWNDFTERLNAVSAGYIEALENVDAPHTDLIGTLHFLAEKHLTLKKQGRIKKALGIIESKFTDSFNNEPTKHAQIETEFKTLLQMRNEMEAKMKEFNKSPQNALLKKRALHDLVVLKNQAKKVEQDIRDEKELGSTKLFVQYGDRITNMRTVILRWYYELH